MRMITVLLMHSLLDHKLWGLTALMGALLTLPMPGITGERPPLAEQEGSYSYYAPPRWGATMDNRKRYGLRQRRRRAVQNHPCYREGQFSLSNRGAALQPTRTVINRHPSRPPPP